MKSLAVTLFLQTAASLSVASAVELSTDSVAGRNLMQSARKLEENDNDVDYSFLSAYAIKFQGCHHVQQWNDEAEGGDENDVRIKTKRLARFRLCPSDSCNSDKSAGCSAKFGDYVVDLNTFMESYMQVLEADQATLCYSAKADCKNNCGDDNDCMKECYGEYGLSFCYDYYLGQQNGENGEGGENEGFDWMEYTECREFEFPEQEDENGDGQRRRRLEDGQGEEEEERYFIGPYCADQGGEIHLGIFTDDTCTTFAQYGTSMFYNAVGYELPYSESSMVSSRCMSCTEGNNNGNQQFSEQCANVYGLSGKCETRMDIDYPNESSCSYIEGIKIIREDGVIRTSQTRKSKAAAVAIGFFMTLAVLLAGYVFYLRTKLSRAQINLQAASQPLT